jgi:hypothetical protein
VKRQEISAPFAITSQGEVLVDVNAFSGMPNPGSLLELVRREGGTVLGADTTLHGCRAEFAADSPG